jgi:hypothetical protein
MTVSHRRLFGAVLGLALLALPAGADQALDGDAIKTALAGATTSGVNVYGNPYTVEFKTDGTLAGVAGTNNEYADTGTWWVDGDTLCRRWTTWLDGATGCFAVSVGDGTITWTDPATGDTTLEHYQAPQ